VDFALVCWLCAHSAYSAVIKAQEQISDWRGFVSGYGAAVGAVKELKEKDSNKSLMNNFRKVLLWIYGFAVFLVFPWFLGAIYIRKNCY